MITRYVHDVPDNFVKDEDAIYLAVVGSRKILEYHHVKSAMATYYRGLGFLRKKVILVSGGALGVDSLAERFATEHGLDMIVIEADWDKYEEDAGFLRNTSIVNIADDVIAIYDGKSTGTLDSIRKANINKKLYATFEVN